MTTIYPTTTMTTPPSTGGLLHHLISSNWNATSLEASASHTVPARFLFTGNGSIMEPVQIVDHLAADQFGALPSEVGLGSTAPQETPLLKLVHDYLLVFLLVSVMFSMGCGVTIKEVWAHLRRPTAVLVCLFAQFGMVPLLAYLIIVFLKLDVLHATGLLILACCPGGVTSNIFTYMADGDLSLSITMTSVATIAALLLMPLNVWLYGRNLETGSLVIPYLEMSGTLILVTIPVLIGMWLNYRFPKVTPYITKTGVFSGFGIILFCQSLEIIIFPTIFVGVPTKLYAAVCLFPFLSFFSGLALAKACKLDEKVCRTIGIEIGIKNVGSALTIVSLSFTIQQLKKAWVFPFLYAFSSFAVIFLVIVAYKWAVAYRAKAGHTAVPTSDKECIKAEEELEDLTESSTGSGSQEQVVIVKTKQTNARGRSKNYEMA